MNRTLLLTGYNVAMSDIGNLTSPLMKAYAERHGMDFRCNRDYPAGVHPAWHKIELTTRALCDGYNPVMWLDADVIVTNPDACDFLRDGSGLHVSQDWGEDAGPDDFSTGVFLAYADTLPLWKDAAKRWWFESGNYFEQGALREAYAEFEWVRDMVHMWSRRALNAVPASTVGAVAPWHSGDFVCHLTGTGTIERRVEVFREIVREAGL